MGEKSDRLYFLGSKITADSDGSHEFKRCLLLGRKPMTNLGSVLKSRGPYSQSYGFSSSHVRMPELDHKEGWVPKNWCFQTVLLEKMVESPLDCKGIKSVNPKGNQPWIFTGRTDAEVEAPTLRPPDAKSQFIGKKPWCWERLKARGERGNWGWDDWMASPTWWTRVWANSRR